MSTDNQSDVNFIPIADPVEDDSQQPDDVNSVRNKRFHRKFRHPPPELAPDVPIEELYGLLLDDDDYFTNPLVSNPAYSSDDTAVEEFDKILRNFGQSGNLLTPPIQSFATSIPQLTSSVTPTLLRSDVSRQTNIQFPNDLYNVPGKVVKHGDVLVEGVVIPQNGNWASGIDYYEEGRLVGFSITCNDPDITPIVFVESGSSSQTVINNMSYRQMTQLGRGMTSAAATSTINTPNGVVSRDVQGTTSSTFPYVARYKDQYTGSGVYSEVVGTSDDKAYTINYEPTTSIPYQRLNFQVYNGSTVGNRMITKFELRRVVYVDPDPIPPSSATLPEISRFTAAINTLATNIGIAPPPSLTPPVQSNFASSDSGDGKDVMKKLYEDFIRFAYNQLNSDNKVDMKYDDSVKISSVKEQEQIQEMMQNLDDKPTIKKHNYPKSMNMTWE